MQALPSAADRVIVLTDPSKGPALLSNNDEIPPTGT
jgi:hypothetical protein